MGLHVFGLTGGIGSGKSTVAARFRARRVPVVDADVLAREVVQRGTEGLAEVVAAFGSGVLGADGELDRAALAERVFSDPAARARLNAITHPRVRELSQARMAELHAAGEPLACYEVPLLVESGLADVLRPLVVVWAPVDVQIARTVARDGCTEEHAQARVAAQMPLKDKAALADHVIDNSGDRESTVRQCDEVLDAICAAFGLETARYPRP